MRSLGWIPLALAAWALAAGCNGEGNASSANSSGPSDDGIVAVVDLERVANEIGSNNRFLMNRQNAVDTANRELEYLRTRLRADVDELQKKKEAATDQKTKDEIDQQIQTKDAVMRAAIADKKNGIDQYAAEMERAFREGIQPAIKRLSEAHNVKLLLLKNDMVLNVSPNSDLTSYLIDDLKANPPALPSAPTPPPPATQPG